MARQRPGSSSCRGRRCGSSGPAAPGASRCRCRGRRTGGRCRSRAAPATSSIGGRDVAEVGARHGRGDAGHHRQAGRVDELGDLGRGLADDERARRRRRASRRRSRRRRPTRSGRRGSSGRRGCRGRPRRRSRCTGWPGTGCSGGRIAHERRDGAGRPDVALGEPVEVAGRDARLELRLDEREDLGDDPAGRRILSISRRDLRVTIGQADRGRAGPRRREQQALADVVDRLRGRRPARRTPGLAVVVDDLVQRRRAARSSRARTVSSSSSARWTSARAVEVADARRPRRVRAIGCRRGRCAVQIRRPDTAGRGPRRDLDESARSTRRPALGERRVERLGLGRVRGKPSRIAPRPASGWSSRSRNIRIDRCRPARARPAPCSVGLAPSGVPARDRGPQQVAGGEDAAHRGARPGAAPGCPCRPRAPEQDDDASSADRARTRSIRLDGGPSPDEAFVVAHHQLGLDLLHRLDDDATPRSAGRCRRGRSPDSAGTSRPTRTAQTATMPRKSAPARVMRVTTLAR